MPNIPRPEHPRPDRVRQEWMNLNGVWQFKMDPGVSGAEQNWQRKAMPFDNEILVPFCMESSLSGIGYKDFMPAVWYRRTLMIPEKWTGMRILLHIGACDFLTRVYVNEKPAGTHAGGYTPLDVDITPALQPGHNLLVIEARDDLRSGLQPAGKQCRQYQSHGCSYTRTTGIWQTVWLEAVPETHIGQFRIQPDPDNGIAMITVTSAGSPASGDIEIRIKADGRILNTVKAKIAHNPVMVSVAIPDAVLWSPGNPHLYDLELTLTTGKGQDVVQSYFGLRKIHTNDRRIYLNNQPLYMRTVLDQGFYPDGIYTAPTDDALRRDIEISQAAGFNGARLHQKIFEPRFLYWADKLGYLVWGEAGNWGCDLNNPFGVANFIDEWTQALERDVNHPSIIGWCPLNETAAIKGQLPKWLHQHLYQWNKTIDPARLAIDTSGYIHYPGVGTDVYDVHAYAMPDELSGQLAPLLQGDWHKAFKNTGKDIAYDGTRPYFVSEFGGIGWNPDDLVQPWNSKTAFGYGLKPKSESEFIERYCRTVQVLLDNPEICGWCYTQLYDIEQEINGLYFYDRRPKFNPAQMQELRAINTAPAKYESP
ncbi:MAG: beta-galactosidase [Verrucomicrobia bacterium]|nr:beta-galactosidase [Verrucomicrobiota bacterium]MCG2680768.1 beta-galactosidase [Kiritimatiellia bacterium]MBU4246906.1 beta-galactosidase [Verrucomicrobiota bacterium]MBU4291294.1 beta-galactosidase [Verrucomicrobiota bacterium]MBU4429949.1 beta-galactosidase [Verrucomicrobiota bacterium]